MKHSELEIHVQGRVQGVNLRSLVWRKARALELTGHVLNRADGSVEIIAQGNRTALHALLYWIQQSPGWSAVRSAQYHWRKHGERFSDFRIVKDSSFLMDQAKSFLNLGKVLFRSRQSNIPAHVAIIPDGNRRWARRKSLAPQMGHYTAASFQHFNELFQAAQEIGVQYLTLWGFSTENWKRNRQEIRAIFQLIQQNLERFAEMAHEQQIRFRHIGRKYRLPRALLKNLEQLERETEKYERFHVQLCLDYGGRDELIRAVNKALKTRAESIDETRFMDYLDSVGIPDVDLIIRTSGEQRISGFMPFQSTYAELYFSDVHFPDFDAKSFKKAIAEYERRQRRFGN